MSEASEVCFTPLRCCCSPRVGCGPARRQATVIDMVGGTRPGTDPIAIVADCYGAGHQLRHGQYDVFAAKGDEGTLTFVLGKWQFQSKESQS